MNAESADNRDRRISAELSQIEAEIFALNARCRVALKRIRAIISHIEDLEKEWCKNVDMS